MMTQKTKIFGVFSPGLYKHAALRKHFDSYTFSLKPNQKVDLVAGWGKKPNTQVARDFAKKTDTQYLALEDGFIHSMSQGRLGAKSWSLVIDKQGIFYDATTPSSLETLINNQTLTKEEYSRAAQNIATIRKYGITKYNNSKLNVPDFIKALKHPVLVVDQVDGDMSISHSLADKYSFSRMLDAALSENPHSDIIVKVHPDVVVGKRKGCIALPKKLPPRIHLLSENINPIKLLEHIEKVYVVSSQIGLEALLLEKTVICFGAPFYAGWGLTDDRLDLSLDVFQRRQKRPNIPTIFYAAFHTYSYYFHPDTNEPCELEDILEYLKLQYSIWQKHTGKLFCIGFSPWKKRFIRSYLQTPDNQIFFVKSAQKARLLGFDNQSVSCIWSSRYENEAKELEQAYSSPIWRIEDGFIRSVSLGSNYAPPASLIIDNAGLYFDPTQLSGLEKILLGREFSREQLVSAEQIRQQLIHQAISKYNVGKRGIINMFAESQNKTKILVPGQVADDASILKGCTDINSNLALLKIVRETYPNAFIVYKPHPDVLSGNRDGHITEQDTNNYCDVLVTDVSITDCLSQVDEVHTMTSLVGFEGLLRGLNVHCYGTPFYSGWGLTKDRHPCPRRTRELTIAQLVAGALIEYPLYMNWATQHFTTPNYTADSIYRHLNQLKADGKNQSTTPPHSWKKLRKKLSLIKTMINPTLK